MNQNPSPAWTQHTKQRKPLQVCECIYIIYLTLLSVWLGHVRTTKNRSKPKDHREYTPDAMETETSIDDHEVKLGYPDWSQISHYQPVFDSLERVPILNRHPSLPILYKYTGEQQHPQRHLYDLPAPTETYIYLFDPSLEGCRLASKFASVHDVPRGPTSTMTSLGKNLKDCFNIYYV
jgi:hypothetical protein